MDSEHEQHVYSSLLARSDALTLNRWLKAKHDLSTAGTEDLAEAAAELPTLVAEHQSIKAVLRQLYPDTAGALPLRGVAILSTAIAALDQRLAALQAALDSRGRPAQRVRTGDAAVALVFASGELLADILAFAGPGEFLFIAPVSRFVRAVYTSTSASLFGTACTTEYSAAYLSASRIEHVMDSDGAFVTALSDMNGDEAMRRSADISALLAETGSTALIRRVHAAGLPLYNNLLIGAARTGSVDHLRSVWRDVLAARKVKTDMWCSVGLELAQVGDDGAGFTWLAAQLRPPERWPAHFANALCHTAAEFGRIATLRFLLSPTQGQRLFGPAMALSLAYVESCSGSSAMLDELRFTDIADKAHVKSLVDAAAFGDDASVLAWLRAEHANFNFTSITMEAAAGVGGVPVLAWLRAHGCPHDVNTICTALLRSTTATPLHMEWVRTCGGGDWSPRGMADMLVLALSCQTPSVARWLRQEGAPWPQDLAGIVLSESVNVHTVLWAVREGCPFGRWTSEVCAMLTTSQRDMAVKRALHDLGCPCDCPRP
eukprot:TRINITY_DN1688_c0_g2_i1.p1 TRINITY_DN1688_c0_g2~~TRINITY_DN1688_c0_g2_i1.p1  ORF type:complete len:567 (-),score=149.39 TRINITY_DN1688_c0_g2_i1:436-2070(-)